MSDALFRPMISVLYRLTRIDNCNSREIRAGLEFSAARQKPRPPDG